MNNNKLTSIWEYEESEDLGFRLERIFEFLLTKDNDEDKYGYGELLPHQRPC